MIYAYNVRFNQVDVKRFSRSFFSPSMAMSQCDATKHIHNVYILLNS